MQNILTEIYPTECIFIQNYTFDDEKLSIQVICKVIGESYPTKPVAYVTAENYLRCLSQACYLLTDHIIEKKLIDIDISLPVFRDAIINDEWYYRNTKMTFHKKIGVQETFKMTILLKNPKEIRILRNFILLTFIIEKDVISGEMDFINKNR